jgi:ribonuclease Y
MIENLSVTQILLMTAILFAGLILGIGFYHINLVRTKSNAKALLEKAKKEADNINKERLFNFKEELQRKRLNFQKELRLKEEKINRQENQLSQREKQLSKEDNQNKMTAARLETRETKINELEELLFEKHLKLDAIISDQNKKLAHISHFSETDARKMLMENLERNVKIEAAQMANDIRTEAKERATKEAKEIIATAIENLAYDFTMESTLSGVELPNERFKGMIIGKEGKNIRAFEELTGVKVIVDDTPELVVMSGFDPVAREVARLAMESLIKSKNININNIQQAVKKAKQDVNRQIAKSAEDTLRELRLHNVHPLMKENLGRLRYRYSYGQNQLQHSIEVAYLAGAMASELGFSVKLARRAGLFHDIGKAISSHTEGSHVTLGEELAKKCREHEVVINSILAHHEEAEPISPISVLVTAADKISGSRPGARRDTLEVYTKRITQLEEIGNSFDGVNKTYAISAGREIRVIVEPAKISDEQCIVLSSDIASKIKETMEYPGQIKVTVIRRSITSQSTEQLNDLQISQN